MQTKIIQVRTLKILWAMPEFSGLWKHQNSPAQCQTLRFQSVEAGHYPEEEEEEEEKKKKRKKKKEECRNTRRRVVNKLNLQGKCKLLGLTCATTEPVNFIELTKWRGSNLNKTRGNITLYNVISIKCL